DAAKHLTVGINQMPPGTLRGAISTGDERRHPSEPFPKENRCVGGGGACRALNAFSCSVRPGPTTTNPDDTNVSRHCQAARMRCRYNSGMEPPVARFVSRSRICQRPATSVIRLETGAITPRQILRDLRAVAQWYCLCA